MHRLDSMSAYFCWTIYWIAFISRRSIWLSGVLKILRHCDILDKFVNIIRMVLWRYGMSSGLQLRPLNTLTTGLKGMLISSEFDFLKIPVTSYRDATAFVKRPESLRVTAIYAQNIKFANTVHTQSPHSVPTASTRRSHNVLTTFNTLLRRARSFCSALMARTHRV